jgi:hypothetical protein
MRKIRLNRIGLFSTFRFGMLLGAALHLVPVFLSTMLFFWAAGLVSEWITGLRGALPLPGGFAVPVDTVSLLGLQQLSQIVEAVAGISAVLAVFIGIFIWLFMALLSGLMALIAAAVFNLAASAVGGIDVDVDMDERTGPPL